MRLCFHIGIQTQDISKKSIPQYIVSGRFGAILWIGHGRIYKISALQKVEIAAPTVLEDHKNIVYCINQP